MFAHKSALGEEAFIISANMGLFRDGGIKNCLQSLHFLHSTENVIIIITMDTKIQVAVLKSLFTIAQIFQI